MAIFEAELAEVLCSCGTSYVSPVRGCHIDSFTLIPVPTSRCPHCPKGSPRSIRVLPARGIPSSKTMIEKDA